MLPAQHRLRVSSDFARVIRTGSRAGRSTLVLHLAKPVSGVEHPCNRPARVGLVVGKGVGNSVVRHRVSRRLRAQLAARIDRLPGGVDLVARAQPAAADAPSARLGADIDSALNRLLRTSVETG